MLFNYFCSALADYVSNSVLSSVIALGVLCAVLGLIVRYMTKSNYAGAIVFLLGVIAIAAMRLLGTVSLENMLPNIMKNMSLYERFNVFVNGVFDVTGIVYYISVTAFFLFLCVQSFEKRRYNG